MNPSGFFSEFGRGLRANEAFLVLLACAAQALKGNALTWDSPWLLLLACFAFTGASGFFSLAASFQKGSPQHDCRLVQRPAALFELSLAALALVPRFLIPESAAAQSTFALACRLYLFGLPLMFVLLWGQLFIAARRMDRDEQRRQESPR